MQNQLGAYDVRLQAELLTLLLILLLTSHILL